MFNAMGEGLVLVFNTYVVCVCVCFEEERNEKTEKTALKRGGAFYCVCLFHFIIFHLFLLLNFCLLLYIRDKICRLYHIR